MTSTPFRDPAPLDPALLDPALLDTVLAAARIVADDQSNVAAAAATLRWDGRAKPPGSLGQVEAVGVRLAAIAGVCPPPVPAHPAVIVFAGDHGCVADGASRWPAEVTVAMVVNMATGGAAINAFAAAIGAELTVVDVGVAGAVEAPAGAAHPVVAARVRAGTDSIASGPAMSVDEARAAVAVGMQVANDRIAAGADLIVGGDMGIGNTAPSAALIAWAAGVAAEDVGPLVGPGAGVGITDDAALATKVGIVQAAVARIAATDDPVAALAGAGGLEIAALAGAYLAACAARVPAVVDGVIAVAAAAVACRLVPGLEHLLVAGHRSTEPAATLGLATLGLEPVLDLDLRLGEGTGAALAVPVIQAAARALSTMADLPG